MIYCICRHIRHSLQRFLRVYHLLQPLETLVDNPQFIIPANEMLFDIGIDFNAKYAFDMLVNTVCITNHDHE